MDSAFSKEDLGRGIFSAAVIEEGAEFVRADIRKLPFPDGSADFILSVNALEHLPVLDITPTLEEWKRVLKDDGEMFLVVPDFDSLAMEWCRVMMKEGFPFEDYVNIMQGVYGNQITEGEFHKSLFNKKLVDSFLATAGWNWWATQVYPVGHPWVRPKSYSIPTDEGAVFRYGSIYVQAYKQGR